MVFIEYDRSVGSRAAKGPMISVAKSGFIGINKLACEKFGVYDFKYAQLYYDPNLKLVALRLTNNINNASATLNMRHKVAQISCRGFFRQFGIDFSKTRRTPVKYDEKSGLLVASVDWGHEP